MKVIIQKFHSVTKLYPGAKNVQPASWLLKCIKFQMVDLMVFYFILNITPLLLVISSQIEYFFNVADEYGRKWDSDA